jgi:hypothetical protein
MDGNEFNKTWLEPKGRLPGNFMRGRNGSDVQLCLEALLGVDPSSTGGQKL